jgi:hypothetical protein
MQCFLNAARTLSNAAPEDILDVAFPEGPSLAQNPAKPYSHLSARSDAKHTKELRDLGCYVALERYFRDILDCPSRNKALLQAARTHPPNYAMSALKATLKDVIDYCGMPQRNIYDTTRPKTSVKQLSFDTPFVASRRFHVFLFLTDCLCDSQTTFGCGQRS